jgi:hypothetical protein
MRTTLSLDEDVAVLLEQVRAEQKLGLKTAINQALREGLRQMSAPKKPRGEFRTASVDMGRCLVGSLDNIGEVLALAEGEDYR